MRTKIWIGTIISCLEWGKMEEVCPLLHCVVSLASMYTCQYPCMEIMCIALTTTSQYTPKVV